MTSRAFAHHFTTSALAAVLMKVLDGASGEAGTQVWTSLTTLARRAFGRGSRPADGYRTPSLPAADPVALIRFRTSARDDPSASAPPRWGATGRQFAITLGRFAPKAG